MPVRSQHRKFTVQQIWRNRQLMCGKPILAAICPDVSCRQVHPRRRVPDSLAAEGRAGGAATTGNATCAVADSTGRARLKDDARRDGEHQPGNKSSRRPEIHSNASIGVSCTGGCVAGSRTAFSKYEAFSSPALLFPALNCAAASRNRSMAAG